MSKEETNRYREEFYSSEKNRLAQNVVSKTDPLEACLNRLTIDASNHVFSHKVKTKSFMGKIASILTFVYRSCFKVDEVKPMTNQKSSGRCWLFAVLNAMRIPFIKSMGMDEMEFSQAHLFFWDKIERSHYFLTTIVSVFKRSTDQTPDSRLASYLLHDPINDGGQWDMVCNIIEKHGVMPKQAFPDTVSCESSRNMNRILKSKLREFAQELYIAVTNDKESDEDVQKRIKGYMSTVFRIVGICLGVPPENFTWQYYDKSKKAHKIGPISPLEFYTTHVKPHFNVLDKACLVTDPRPSNPTGQTYTVDCLGNVVGAKMTVYNNQSVDVLADLASKSIQAGEPVWFGCDVSKFFSRKKGFLDLELFGKALYSNILSQKGKNSYTLIIIDFNLVFDTQIYIGLNKSDRLNYGDSLMNHAMLLTGVHIEVKEME